MESLKLWEKLLTISVDVRLQNTIFISGKVWKSIILQDRAARCGIVCKTFSLNANFSLELYEYLLNIRTDITVESLEMIDPSTGTDPNSPGNLSNASPNPSGFFYVALSYARLFYLIIKKVLNTKVFF